jgi:mono/diheme cytochrome c family protein
MKLWAVLPVLTFMTGHLTAQATEIERGEYLLHAAGCITCHTMDEKGAPRLAGGRALETPFGTFYSPNITPDANTGIGGWDEQMFLDALHNGVAPDGSGYFPAFPYTSYTGMTEADALAIKAYLFSLEPVGRPNQPHELGWYLGSRMAASAWQMIAFTPAGFVGDPNRDAQWNRGAYLVRHLGHCGECHTPRNALGKILADQELFGNAEGPEGEKVPDISQHRDDGIGRWTIGDIELFLEIGMLPDGDFTGSVMSEVIDDNTGRLTAEDRTAIATYLKSLPASDATH